MVYRVRYIENGKDIQETEIVEAHSPSEAMIKFELEHSQTSKPPKHTITSVCAEDVPV